MGVSLIRVCPPKAGHWPQPWRCVTSSSSLPQPQEHGGSPRLEAPGEGDPTTTNVTHQLQGHLGHLHPRGGDTSRGPRRLPALPGADFTCVCRDVSQALGGWAEIFAELSGARQPPPRHLFPEGSKHLRRWFFSSWRAVLEVRHVLQREGLGRIFGHRWVL